ncbi:hypothetical protein Dimus_039249 [Dionaea muscipula]
MSLQDMLDFYGKSEEQQAAVAPLVDPDVPKVGASGGGSTSAALGGESKPVEIPADLSLKPADLDDLLESSATGSAAPAILKRKPETRPASNAESKRKKALEIVAEKVAKKKLSEVKYDVTTGGTSIAILTIKVHMFVISLGFLKFKLNFITNIFLMFRVAENLKRRHGDRNNKGCVCRERKKNRRKNQRKRERERRKREGESGRKENSRSQAEEEHNRRSFGSSSLADPIHPWDRATIPELPWDYGW